MPNTGRQSTFNNFVNLGVLVRGADFLLKPFEF
jgi:hypothetical protein